MHVPDGVQQAPVGTQSFGEQSVPLPCHALGDAQEASVVTVQVPAGAQQAPVGCGHGLGEQSVDAPCQSF